ncbi:PocR ligand-binding domain-containing protein [Candidatus Formimonas warabiya]|uniref:histidine kinase n=1 Tax=Formimonas warabiya TaxID=1761012 RepID=A0A3G1KLZ9_FORW1|nr:PocR ligand-binding domain-containing protein [Candidatus Formimonas warabiya]ATW23438.1 hypothetical protein DCMF_00280 [Candidatus Formimonas warabiya]
MKYTFSKIVDIPKIQALMEEFYLATGIPCGIIDTDANILVSVAWQDICTKFHRKNAQALSLCHESDMFIKDHLNSGQPYVCYECPLGLIEAAAPIMIDGEHLATIFQGQFFFRAPDIKRFYLQARLYGFDEKDYLAALEKVPFLTPEKLYAIMGFFRQLAELLAYMGFANLKLLESKEKVVQESEDRLKTIINNSPCVAIQSYDLEGKVLFWNQASEKMFGWTEKETVGRTLREIMRDENNEKEFQDILQACGKSENTYGPFVWNITNKNGIEKSFLSTAFPIHYDNEKTEFIRMNVDITEQKQMEQEFIRFDQLNLIGEMAASIGHEVRNPMTTVRGFLQLLLGKDDCRTYHEYFHLMIEELDRANAIITEFLSLAKSKAVKLEMKSLNAIIAAPLIDANSLLYGQNFRWELGEIPHLALDENEIRQLILNLTQNGIEAMSPGKSLTISTFKESAEVVLSVQDEGKGIRADLLDKLGRPFLSTKEHGTGLGLAVCYSIAARHHARITVESSPEGTTFFVRFKV